MDSTLVNPNDTYDIELAWIANENRCRARVTDRSSGRIAVGYGNTGDMAGDSDAIDRAIRRLASPAADIAAQTMTDEQELILDMFTQACWDDRDGLYSHDFLTTYVSAQKYLIRHGIIRADECRYR